MDDSEKKSQLREILSQFKSPKAISFLLSELFQRDEKSLSYLMRSLQSALQKKKPKLNQTSFMPILEDKILERFGRKKNSWLDVLAFMDLIAFHLYRSKCQWKAFQLQGAKQLESPLTEKELLALRSSIKSILPERHSNLVQQLIIYPSKAKSDKNGLREEPSLTEEEGSIICLFRITSILITKAKKKDPLQMQRDTLKAKPLFFAFSNGTPHIFSPVSFRRKLYLDTIKGVFNCSNATKMEPISHNLNDLISNIRLTGHQEVHLSASVEENPDSRQDEPMQMTSVENGDKRKIKFSNIAVETKMPFKGKDQSNKSEVYRKEMAVLMRLSGEDIHTGIEGLRHLGILDAQDSKWMNDLPNAEDKELSLSGGKLRPNKKPHLHGAKKKLRLF